MWLSLVFHSLAARCKVRLCAPAGERELCVHESSLSMTQLLPAHSSFAAPALASVLHDASKQPEPKKLGFGSESYRTTGLASRAAPPAAPSVHELAGRQSHDVYA